MVSIEDKTTTGNENVERQKKGYKGVSFAIK